MAFTVTNEGFSFAGRYDGLTVTRTYLVTPGSAWLSAVRQLLGGIKYIGGQLVRVPGLVDPELPGLFCEDDGGGSRHLYFQHGCQWLSAFSRGSNV